MMTLSNNLETEIMELKKILDQQQNDFKKAQKVYETFKQLREQIGKSQTDFYDTKSVLKGLRGDEFTLLIKDHEWRGKTNRERHQLYW